MPEANTQVNTPIAYRIDCPQGFDIESLSYAHNVSDIHYVSEEPIAYAVVISNSNTNDDIGIKICKKMLETCCIIVFAIVFVDFCIDSFG